MTRLAAQEKAEYYPTPLDIVDLVAESLVPPPDGMVRLLDPCAGEGIALERLAAHLRRRTVARVETWGVELHPGRAEAARERLDAVLAAPFEAAGFRPAQARPASVLFLNPPYDFSEGGHQRMEVEFLVRAAKWQPMGGVLIYIVPVTALYFPQLIHRLWEEYEDIRVWRFPDDLFEKFKQVVIMGRKRTGGRRYPDCDHPLYRMTCGTWGQIMRIARDLPQAPPGLYEIPRAIPQATLVRTSWTEEEIREALREDGNQGLARALFDLFGQEDARPLEPLMPPKRGHIAQLLAAGLMGTIAFPGEVIKGRAVKRTELVEETVEEDEEGEKVKRVFRDVYETHIVHLTPSGLRHLSRPEEVREFLEAHADRLASLLRNRVRPYGNSVTEQENAILDRLSPNRLLPGMTKPGLLPAQREAAIAATRALRRHGVCHLVAEMGFGKTTTALAVVELMGAYPALVICPPHLVEKWVREAGEVIPGAQAVVAESIADVQALRASFRPGDRLIVIISRSYIKLGPGWRPAYVLRRLLPEGQEDQAKRRRFREALKAYAEARRALAECPPGAEREEMLRSLEALRKVALEAAPAIPACPDCGAPVLEGPIRSKADLERSPRRCPHCGAALYCYVPKAARRWPLADYIRKKMRGFFRLLVADEVHQYKAKESDQGWAFGLLVGVTRWTLSLTGTFFGGPSTSIFWLLHRTQRDVREAFGFSEEARWVERYGVREITVFERRHGGENAGVLLARRRQRTSVKEKPGISPVVVRHILPTTIFRSISDLGLALPPFRDEVVYLEMTPEQERDYLRLYEITWTWLLEAWPRYTASWLQWTLSRPNSCFRDEVVVGPGGEQVVFPAVVPEGGLLPKEEWLANAIRREIAEGRRVLVYVRQTGTRDIRGRLAEVLARVGVEARILPESVDPRKREEWLRKNSSPVLIVNPRLVETGLDLVEFSTVIFYEPDYSLYTLWQACRRVWRLGQTKPVRVFYLVYVTPYPDRPTLEDRALRLMGQKMAAAQLLYGDDVGGAIVPEMDDNIVVQILRSIQSKEQPERAAGLFGAPSPIGSPTHVSPPLFLLEEWLRSRGLDPEKVYQQSRRPRRKAVTVPQGQLVLFGI